MDDVAGGWRCACVRGEVDVLVVTSLHGISWGGVRRDACWILKEFLEAPTAPSGR